MFLFCKRRLEVIVKKLFSARVDCVSDSNVPSIFVFNFYENKGRDRLAWTRGDDVTAIHFDLNKII